MTRITTVWSFSPKAPRLRRKTPPTAAAVVADGGQSPNQVRAFVEDSMGNTVVASFSPNGEWFAGNRREKAAVRGAWWWHSQWRGGGGSREPWRRERRST